MYGRRSPESALVLLRFDGHLINAQNDRGYNGGMTRSPSARIRENARLLARIRALQADQDGVVSWSMSPQQDRRPLVQAVLLVVRQQPG